MADFNFIQEPSDLHWTIISPRRSKRPNVSKGTQASVCPFCPGFTEELLYKIPQGTPTSTLSLKGQKDHFSWSVAVIPNKFPFASIHEIIIHSPDHHKSWDELPRQHGEKILQVFKDRFNFHKDKGQVYIFTNAGESAGESILHPHSQLVVVPFNVQLNIAKMPQEKGEELETELFNIFCPPTASWPDEVWVAPKRANTFFGDILPEEIIDLSFILQRLLQIMDIRHGQEFSYNLYLSPFKSWYLRFIPRSKILGGFEIGTGVFVNTQDPKETFAFLKAHFENPNEGLIRQEHLAEYTRSV